MSSVTTDFPEVKCQRCRANVVAAETDAGIPYPVEKVKRGSGNVGLTASLFGEKPQVVLRAGPTRWRAHQCDARAFSADSFTRKVRP